MADPVTEPVTGPVTGPVAEPAAGGATAAPRAARRARPGQVVRPLWERTFRDPVREGRLRLVGLDPADRQLARMGLVALGLLLVSVLGSRAWRHGGLTQVQGITGVVFVPDGVLAVTLVCFGLGWLLLAWGAFDAAPSVRLLVAVLFLLVDGAFVARATLDLGSTGGWAIRHGPLLVRLGFWTVPGVLVLSAVLARWPRVERLAHPVLRALAAAAVALLFGGLVWIHHTFLAQGLPSPLPVTVTNAISGVSAALLWLLYVSAVAVVDFALDVSGSVLEPARAVAARWLRPAVLALVLVKVWFEVGGKRDFWSTYLTAQPLAVLRTVLSVVGLGLLVVVVTRFRSSDDTEAAQEGLVGGAAAALGAAYLVQAAWVGLGVLVFAVSGSTSVATSATHLPMTWLNTWGLAVLAGLAVVAGAGLMRRSEGGLGDEIGSGMIVVGAWACAGIVVANSGLQLGLSLPAVDVTLTLAVLAVLLARWRRVDSTGAVTLATVVLFGWLVTSQGDYISYLGALLGLPAAVVLVFGIVWTLASGSAFTAASSRRLPADSRSLLYLGYLLLSVTILHWQQTTHDYASVGDQQAAYYFLAVPVGAWLLGRRVLARPGPSAGARPVSPR